MNKVINKMIELVFDKHCSMKEVAYQQDALVCDDLIELKNDIKEVVSLYLSELNGEEND